MLHLTRRTGEVVSFIDSRTGELIGELMVLGWNTKGLQLDSIRMGFDFPPHITILRDNARNKEPQGNDQDN